MLDLHEGETVIEEVKGDYWAKSFLFVYEQKIGKYWFTSERIIFIGGFATKLDIPYADITGAEKCLVGPMFPFMPTGIKGTVKDGKKYKLSLLKRMKYIELITEKRD